LLGWWNWHVFKEQNKDLLEKDKSLLNNVYMCYSTVSSNILKSIAHKEGFKCEDTLTGFKWMGNRSHELLKQNKKILFCFEEAIGFMCGTNVLDKDGISAEAVIAEMAVYLNEVEKKSLTQKLDWIYEKFKFYLFF
jgi:phosphomannomutase